MTGNRILENMAIIFMACMAGIILSGAATAVIAPHEEWNKTFGGIGYTDWARSVQQTSDGGYILAGYTDSFGAGAYDAWLIKTNSSGSEQWNRTYGGKDSGMAYSVKQISDGGYIIAGYVSVPATGVVSALLIKTDSSGNKLWSKTFGSIGESYANSVQQTSDGGYILAGYTRSSGAGGYDFWLIKTDASGNERWSKTYGGISQDYAYSVQQTSDGGYVLAGFTSSFGVGNNDAWLIKIDSSGNEQWNKTFGGEGSDQVYSVQQTSDGGYILAGYTGSFGVSMNDAWLIKTDSSGNEQWKKTFGGYNHDYAYSVQQTSDGGYILAGVTNNYGASYGEAWLIKADLSGNEQWNETFGGASFDQAFSVQQTSDGGYILGGFTRSFGTNPDSAWLIKVSNETPIPTPIMHAQVIIPYLDSGYKYKVVAFNEVAGFEQPSFDDTGFSVGNAGFGSLSACSLNNPTYVKTSWPLNSDMLLRKEFNLPSGSTNVRVGVAIDNDVQVFINGIDVSGGLISHDFCPARDSLIFTIPDNVLTTGSNLLAVRARDRGDQDYIDVQIMADVPMLPLTAAIELPTNNFYSEELVNFKGTASGGTPPYTYTWFSTKEGTFRTITTTSTADEFSQSLTLKEHDIILTVQDSAGGIQSQLITLNVVKQKIKLLVVPVLASGGSLSDADRGEIIKLANDATNYYMKSSYDRVYLDFNLNFESKIGTSYDLLNYGLVTWDVLNQLKYPPYSVDLSQYNTLVIVNTGNYDDGRIYSLYDLQNLMGNKELKYPQTAVQVPLHVDYRFGVWVHEIGHSLGNTVKTSQAYIDPERYLWGGISEPECIELYNCGNVNAWDIMAKSGFVFNSMESGRINQPTDMSILSKTRLRWLTDIKVDIGTGGDYPIISTENMHYGDTVLVYKTNLYSDITYYVEARELMQPSYYRLKEKSNLGYYLSLWKTLNNGIVVYKIQHYSSGKSSINILRPASDSSRGPTLLASDGTSASYSDCDEFVKFGVSSSDSNHPYHAVVRIGDSGPECKAKKGAVLHEKPMFFFPLNGFSPSENTSTIPDLDLHAVTPEGLHIGINYTSGEYEMQIPGGVSSGDLMNGEEWIFVPTGTEVRYYVDSHDVQEYLNENPDIDPANATMNYSITSMEYGENPQSVELPDGNWTVTDRNISVPEAGTIGPGIIVEMNTTPVWERYINGTVTDSINKTGIVDVTVSANIDISTKTNATGFYSLIVGGGTYNLKVDLEPIYYVNNSVTFSTVESAVSVQNFELLKKPTGNIRGGVTIK